MMVPATHSLCPYTLKPLTSLEAVNDEHIFPDAIGGAKDYCIKVCTKANSDLGTRVDAPLVDSFLMGALRSLYGIRSRSRKAERKVRGKCTDSGQEVDVVLTEGGGLEVRARTSVEVDNGGTSALLTLPVDKRDDFLANFIEGHKRKGRTVIVTAESKGTVEPIHVPVTFDLTALKRALAKMAYLVAYDYLGDAFLADPLVAEWHKAFMSDNPNDIYNARIHGLAFDTYDQLSLLFPPLQPYEHGAAIVNLKQKGPVVAVALFGTGFHTLIAQASETSNYGLTEGEGRIAICNAKDGKTRFILFLDHLVETALQKPSFGPDWGINNV